MFRQRALGNQGGYTSRQLQYKSRRMPKRKLKSKLRFGRKVRTAVENYLLEKANYIINQAGRVSWTLGQQGFASALIQNSRLDLNAINTAITTAVTTGTTGSNQTSTAPSNWKPSKFTITSYSAELNIKNQTQTSVVVDIYELRPRMDLINTPGTLYGLINTDQAAPQAGTSGQPSPSVMAGATPYMGNAFCSMYKIVRKQRFIMAPGGLEVITFRDSKNYVIENEVLQQNSSYTVFKRWSKLWFIIARGEPLNELTTNTNINFGAGAIDWTTTETYFYTYAVQNQCTTNYSVGNLTYPITTPSSATVTNAAANTDPLVS